MDEEYLNGKNRKRGWCSICVVFFLVIVTAAVVIPVIFVVREWIIKYPEDFLRTPPSYRVNCHPEPNPNSEKCLARGCQWSPAEFDDQPSCIFPDGHGYRVEENIESNVYGQKLRLQRVANGTLFGGDVQTVTLQVRYISREIVQLKFYDEAERRFEVPEDPPIDIDTDLFNKTYDVVWRNDPQFGLLVRRRSPDPGIHSTGNVYDMTLVFDTRNPGFVFSSQFLQLPIRLPSFNVYGLGSLRRTQLRHDLQWRTWTLWSRPLESQVLQEDGFGSHPFIMCLENDGRASAIFLRNSNAMEAVLQPEPAVVFRTTGGVLDFFVFLGPTPEAVVQQYMRIIGRPTLPPYWSLGFHFGRQRIGNTSNLEEILNSMVKSNIPFDSFHLGDDILENQNSFSVASNYQGHLPFILQSPIQYPGRRITVSTWAGIVDIPDFPASVTAKDMGLVIKQANKTTVCHGKLYNQEVVYPDYSNEKAVEYWRIIVQKYRNDLQFDTLYLDKNTPTSEINGCSDSCFDNNWNKPPYVPPALKNILHKYTLCPDVNHAKGRHYDVHNLYGLYQARAAYQGFLRAFHDQRPFVMSQSHAPGIGRYAGHIISGTTSQWSDLQRSIIDIMQLNLVGIPMVGNDICGYYGNVSETLCMRWMQAGAFYPFSRNYNYGDTRNQFPSAWDQLTTVEKNRQALRLRYSLLPYLYTLFYLASSTGGTVVRPLFHEFPTDNKTWEINDQFLWGPGLMISPVLKPQNSEPTYLPDGRWYDIQQRTEVQSPYGMRMIPRNDLTVLIRGGYVIPMHSEFNTTSYNNFPYRLVVALDDREEAEGMLYVDEKEKPYINQPLASGAFIKFSLKDNIFTVNYVIKPSDSSIFSKLYIKTIEFWGMKTQPLDVLVNYVKCGLVEQCQYNTRDKISIIDNLHFPIAAKDSSTIKFVFKDENPYGDDI